MPTYTVDIPGQGSFDVESDHDLSDTEAYNYALQSAGGGEAGAPAGQPPSPAPSASLPIFDTGGYYEKTFGQTAPDANALQQYAGITGRRVGSALDAAIGLPSAIGDIFTGGRNGRLDAVLRTLQGVASPVSAILAPVEAAGEEAVTGLTGSPQWGRLGGDITGLASTFGLGALAKAGMVGETGMELAKILGVGRPKTFEELVKRDPQMRFIAEREPTIGASNLEMATRGPSSMAQLAMDLKRPEMARVALQQDKQEAQLWQEWAKENAIISDIPPDPQLQMKNIIFDDTPSKDLNLFQTLGTPATRAAAIDKTAGQAAYEMQLAETNMSNAINNREARTLQALNGLTDEEARAGVLTQRMVNPEDIPNANVSENAKKWAQYLNDKFEVDRQIAIPRARDDIRPKIAKMVKDEMGDTATDAEMVNEVNKRVIAAIPDNTGIDQMVLNLFPGMYKIMDKEGNVLRTADSGLMWKNEVLDLVKNGGMDPKDLKVEAQAYLDTDLLRKFKGRTQRSLNHLANGLTPNADEVAAAARGEFATQKAWQMMGQLNGETGSSAKGYADAVKDMLYTYDRSFERWLQVGELKDKVTPMINEVGKRYPSLANMLRDNMRTLWGHRMPGSAGLDNLIAATPILRDLISPMALERWSSAGKSMIVNALLKYNPKFQAVNATQTLATLWPIADAQEIMQGLKLGRSEVGQQLLNRHGISGAGTKIEGWASGLGPAEKFNQETAFLTMYNRARKLGFSDAQSADYAKLRGNVYSQFMGLTTDQPMAFRKMDPTGMLLMFKRFPVKQTEMVIDLLKDKNLPGAAKWLGVNMALGGFKSATLGSAGWLTYKLYKDIEQNYGKPVADVFHTGLPALIGSDISGSVQLLDPPFGEDLKSQLGNFAAGPFLSIGGSILGTMMDNSAVDPNTARRVMHSIANRNPLLKGLYQLFQPDIYDFRDPSGRLKWKGDAKDLARTFLGLRSAGGTMGVTEGPQQMKDAELDTFIDAFMDVNQRRGDTLDYAASRYGQAMAAGVDLGKEMTDAVKKEVDSWNNMWPEFPITGSDIMDRAKRRQEAIMQGTAQRMLKQIPAVMRNSTVFGPPPPQPEVPPPPIPGLFPDYFVPGGG